MLPKKTVLDDLPVETLDTGLPEDWKLNDAVTPTGTDAGLSEKHGYNYLMRCVNTASDFINKVITVMKKLRPVAFSGSYTDLSDVPSAMKNPESVVVKINGGTDEGTDQFSYDGSSDKTIDIPIHNHNLLINGDFQVWQRGDVFDIGVTKYTADRWICFFSATEGYKKYSISNNLERLCVLPPADGGKYLVYQHTELDDSLIRKIRGKTLTLSVKVISNVVHTIGLGVHILYNDKNKTYKTLGNKRQSCVAGEYTIINMSFVVPEDADFNDVKSLQVTIGSGVANAPVYFDYAKLEIGSVATPFVPRNYGEELQLCKRYYEYMGTSLIRNMSSIESKTAFILTQNYKTEKRVTPTFSISHIGSYNNSSVDTGIKMTGVGATNRYIMNIMLDTSIPIGACNYVVGLVADAEIH